MIGLLWTLTAGLTALRLKLIGSKSSSLRLLLFSFRVISAADGIAPGCGVDTLGGDEPPVGGITREDGGVDIEGEMSSLTPEVEPR
jgi:hypothetical protein